MANVNKDKVSCRTQTRVRKAVRPTVRANAHPAPRLRDIVQVRSGFALDADITPHEKMVYLVLAAYANDDWRCNLRQRLIAGHCQRSERFIRRILSRLREKQCIRTARRMGGTEFELLR
jgi:hypothetical protein